MTSPDYTYSRLLLKHLPGFVSLFEVSYNKKITEDQVCKILGNDSDWIGYIAFEGRLPIGFYGVVPVYVNMEGQSLKAAQSLFTMVHPKYRGGEVLFKLVEYTEQLAARKGIQFIFGWPNSPKLFKDLLLWEELDSMKKYSFKVLTLPLGKIVWKLSFLRRMYEKYFLLFLLLSGYKIKNDSEIAVMGEDLTMIPRNNSYLNYKKTLGSFVIKIEGKIVWIGKDYNLKIGDIENCDFTHFQKILKKLKSIAFWTGITEISFIVNEQSSWNQILQKRFKSRPSMQLMYRPLNKDCTLKSVYFTGGDFDTF